MKSKVFHTQLLSTNSTLEEVLFYSYVSYHLSLNFLLLLEWKYFKETLLIE